jgi:hypothetical protein
MTARSTSGDALASASVGLVLGALILVSACAPAVVPAPSDGHEPKPDVSTSKAPNTLPPQSPPTSTGTQAARPSASLNDETQIRELIDTFWSEWLRAGDPPDPQHQSLIGLLTGDSLEREVEDLEKKRALGEARRLPPNARFSHLTTSVVVTGARATVSECVADDSQLVDLKTGEILNGAEATFRLEKTVVKENGRWLLESSSIVTETEGIQPCA